jgi:pyruvate, water dikinase
MSYIRFFKDLTQKDIALVGGKNASLGEMIKELITVDKGNINVPLGFALTTKAYWDLLEQNHLVPHMKKIMQSLHDNQSLKTVQEVGAEIRSLIYEAQLPPQVITELTQAYKELSSLYHTSDLDVAVRSSATAEDLPHASFAGQQETYLHISGIEEVIDATKRCMASLFTDRAIVYRIEQGFDHFQVAISVGIQKMVRSDLASSGVIFSLDTDTGFKNVVVITSSYGLGENIVKGTVNPDEFHVHKPTLALGYRSIIKKYLGSKELKLTYSDNREHPLENIPVSYKDQHRFSLSDDEILELARQTIVIENHYSALKGSWSPMDIEWAKDGIDGKLYIVQARPETVYGSKKWEDMLIRYTLKGSPEKKIITHGLSIGQKIANGEARILKSIHEHHTFRQGDILVTAMTDPDWVPLMKKASAIITDKGGRTCHAAIVSRELGIPAIVGTSNATELIKDGEIVTADCSRGSTAFVYQGALDFEVIKTELKTVPKPRVPVLVNIADPDRAYKLSFLPVSGVGLARVEFIINSFIKVHPMAVCQPEKIKDPRVKKIIEEYAEPYKDAKTYFIDTLAQGIGIIAAAFYPREVIVRLSDFKSNEYRNLLAGEDFEPIEDNPMLGFRGAVRYCDPSYAPAFALECAALSKARNEMGMTNIKILVPFVRNLYEATCTIAALQEQGINRGDKGLQILMMCEIPSNVILLEEFSPFFDGFSIGSNDLTQFTLAVDRDSGILSPLFNENDPAVKKMFKLALEAAHRSNTPMSICGQAPSDYPEIAEFLIKHGISALSLNPDSVIPFLLKEPRG